MFSSTLAAAAVTGLLTATSLGPTSGWQTDYSKALSIAAQWQRPVAVFIAPGGPEKLIADGKLDENAAKLLRQGYVALAIDPATPTGQQLAASFNMTEGLVISDKTGGVQALRHDGPVPAAELTGYLTRFAQPSQVVTTEYGGRNRPLLQQPYGPGRPVMNTVSNVRSFFSGST
jgi:hypothetical protein